MMGPQQQRLQRYLQGADAGSVHDAAQAWQTASMLLSKVADNLERHSKTPPDVIGGQTGVAVSNAFTHSATSMRTKSEELQHGSEAMAKASGAIKHGETARDSMGPEQGAKPTEGS